MVFGLLGNNVMKKTKQNAMKRSPAQKKTNGRPKIHVYIMYTKEVEAFKELVPLLDFS